MFTYTSLLRVDVINGYSSLFGEIESGGGGEREKKKIVYTLVDISKMTLKLCCNTCSSVYIIIGFVLPPAAPISLVYKKNILKILRYTSI